jgi:hemin uptake protein HemP
MDKSSTPASAQTVLTAKQINAPAKTGVAGSLKRLCSAELFSGARELVIEHAGDEYRLRQTSQGKLILTK